MLIRGIVLGCALTLTDSVFAQGGRVADMFRVGIDAISGEYLEVRVPQYNMKSPLSEVGPEDIKLIRMNHRRARVELESGRISAGGLFPIIEAELFSSNRIAGVRIVPIVRVAKMSSNRRSVSLTGVDELLSEFWRGTPSSVTDGDSVVGSFSSDSLGKMMKKGHLDEIFFLGSSLDPGFQHYFIEQKMVCEVVGEIKLGFLLHKDLPIEQVSSLAVYLSYISRPSTTLDKFCLT